MDNLSYILRLIISYYIMYLSFHNNSSVGVIYMLAKYILREADFQKLLDAPWNLRDKLLIRLYYVTGARTMEIARLKKSDVNLESNSIMIIDSKKKIPFIIPIDVKTTELLRGYMSTLDNDYLFPSRQPSKRPYLCKEAIDYIIKWYAAKIDLPYWNKWSPRQFRRHIARYWVQQHGDLTVLQQLLRHTNFATTAGYVDAIRFDTELRSEYDKVMNRE